MGRGELLARVAGPGTGLGVWKGRIPVQCERRGHVWFPHSFGRYTSIHLLCVPCTIRGAKCPYDDTQDTIPVLRKRAGQGSGLQRQTDPCQSPAAVNSTPGGGGRGCRTQPQGKTKGPATCGTGPSTEGSGPSCPLVSAFIHAAMLMEGLPGR